VNESPFFSSVQFQFQFSLKKWGGPQDETDGTTQQEGKNKTWFTGEITGLILRIYDSVFEMQDLIFSCFQNLPGTACLVERTRQPDRIGT
jgi:hypothetical protein